MSAEIETAGQLSGRVVMITGGAGGIGAAQARAAVQNGASAVLVADVNEDAAGDLALELGPRARPVRLDVTSADGWSAALRSAREVAGRPVDVLLHTAGVIVAAPLVEFDETAFRRQLDVNLVGFFLGLRAVVPGMTEAGRGSIVAMSSVDSFGAVPTFGAYAAAKAGMLALVRAAAVELADRAIRVNAIAPGAVDSPMTRSADDPPEALAAFARQVPLGRVATPTDVARASLFLASDAADYITGTVLPVDGGTMARIPLTLEGWTMPPQ